MKTGTELIMNERAHQIVNHGRTARHDFLNNKHGELIHAAREMSIPNLVITPEYLVASRPKEWSASMWEKMCGKPYIERLVIAGALIAAEIDRLIMQKDEEFENILNEIFDAIEKVSSESNISSATIIKLLEKRSKPIKNDEEDDQDGNN